MTYERIKHLKATEFKRLCGVRPETFAKMLQVLQQWAEHKRKPGGPTKLSLEDQLLLTLEYWREYRTYFHMGQSWGIHESTVCRIVNKMETILAGSGAFKLPGKKQLQQPDYELEVVVVDVSETPIERPQKNKSASTVAKRSVTPSSLR